jgi:isorenieratene synthase
MTPPRLHRFGRRLPPLARGDSLPDWQAADPMWIANALAHAQRRPSGGWYAVADAAYLPIGASRTLGARVRGCDYVLWRAAGGVRAAIDRCPHMGASLVDALVRESCIVCPWHGRELGTREQPGWRPLNAYDDGVLIWLSLPENGTSVTESPLLPKRPSRHFAAVMRQEARCEPADILANRLDPWHGAHYHPHSFADLRVVQQLEDEITVRVVYRIGPRWGIEVEARFHCPDSRTVAMTIVAGEGIGSVVETHATPIEPGRALVLEAVLATSDRPQFWWVVRALGQNLRPLVERMAHKLWQEDAAYAERRHSLRKADG